MAKRYWSKSIMTESLKSLKSSGYRFSRKIYPNGRHDSVKPRGELEIKQICFLPSLSFDRINKGKGMNECIGNIGTPN